MPTVHWIDADMKKKHNIRCYIDLIIAHITAPPQCPPLVYPILIGSLRWTDICVARNLVLFGLSKLLHGENETRCVACPALPRTGKSSIETTCICFREPFMAPTYFKSSLEKCSSLLGSSERRNLVRLPRFSTYLGYCNCLPE